MADVRALRNRNVNIITENANGAGAPSKRGLKPEGKEGKEEPKPKRAALTEISTNVNQACEAISNVLIDSTKKVLDAVPKSRGSKRSNSASELAVISEEVIAAKPAEEDPCPEYDFDAETGNDPYSVSEYARDIFKYYKYFIVGDYLKKQKHITRENRAVIGDWMVEVQESFELNHETLYLAVKLVDLYLDRTKDHKKKDDLQVIASTAVFIASKFDERQPPMVDDFMYICGDSFTRDELTDMERDMLDVVGFDLGAPLSYRYLRRYSRVVKAPMDTLTLARFILETSLMFYEFVDASECLMAAGAFLLALRMKDSTANWSPVLRKYSGLSEVMVEEAASVLNHMMWIRSRVFPKLDTVFKKYSHEVFFQSALVPMLPDSLPAEAPLSFPQL